MDGSIAYVIIGGIFLLIGFAGTIVPILPGAPLAWLGLLLAYFSVYTDISVTALIITAVIAVLVSVLDRPKRSFPLVAECLVVCLLFLYFLCFILNLI